MWIEEKEKRTENNKATFICFRWGPHHLEARCPMSFPGVTQYPQRAKRERKISKRITMSGLSVTRTSLRIWKEETTHHEDVLSLKQCIWHLLLGTHKQNQCHAFSVHPPLTIASDDRNVVQLLISDAIAERSNVVRYLHHRMLLRCTAIEMRSGNQRTSENLSPSHQVIELHRCLHFCKALCRRAESDAGTLVFFLLPMQQVGALPPHSAKLHKVYRDEQRAHRADNYVGIPAVAQ